MNSNQAGNTKKRIAEWIEKLELQAENLLESVDMAELSAKERMELALKCMTQIQRFMMLNQQLESESPSGGTTVMLAALMRQMRGEPPLVEVLPPLTEESRTVIESPLAVEEERGESE